LRPRLEGKVAVVIIVVWEREGEETFGVKNV